MGVKVPFVVMGHNYVVIHVYEFIVSSLRLEPD